VVALGHDPLPQQHLDPGIFREQFQRHMEHAGGPAEQLDAVRSEGVICMLRTVPLTVQLQAVYLRPLASGSAGAEQGACLTGDCGPFEGPRRVRQGAP
jgi:hypothetical protein